MKPSNFECASFNQQRPQRNHALFIEALFACSLPTRKLKDMLSSAEKNLYWIIRRKLNKTTTLGASGDPQVQLTDLRLNYQKANYRSLSLKQKGYSRSAYFADEPRGAHLG